MKTHPEPTTTRPNLVVAPFWPDAGTTRGRSIIIAMTTDASEPKKALARLFGGL